MEEPTCTKIAFLIAVFSVSATAALSQSNAGPPQAYCDSIRALYPRPDSAMITYIEQQPKLRGGVDALYEQVYYTEEAESKKIEGTVWVSFIVNEKGRPVCLDVVRELGHGLDKIAQGAVKRQRFAPGKQGGEAVAFPMTLPIRFELPQPDD